MDATAFQDLAGSFDSGSLLGRWQSSRLVVFFNSLRYDFTAYVWAIGGGLGEAFECFYFWLADVVRRPSIGLHIYEIFRNILSGAEGLLCKTLSWAQRAYSMSLSRFGSICYYFEDLLLWISSEVFHRWTRSASKIVSHMLKPGLGSFEDFLWILWMRYICRLLRRIPTRINPNSLTVASLKCMKCIAPDKHSLPRSEMSLCVIGT